MMPPPRAPNAKNPRIIKKMLLTILTFIMFFSFLSIWISIEMVCNGIVVASLCFDNNFPFCSIIFHVLMGVCHFT
jgi:hypothetical protein